VVESMAKILFQAEMPVYRVPGLKYSDEEASSVRTILLDGIPSEGEISYFLSQGTKDILVSPWTVNEVWGFGQYVPSTFKKISKNMPQSLFHELFDDSFTDDRNKTIFQLQSELASKGSTIDSAIIHKRRDEQTVRNKVHNLNRLVAISKEKGLIDFPYPILKGDIQNPEEWDDILIWTKKKFIELYSKLPMNLPEVEYETRTARIDSNERNKYGYLEWLKERLGDNLEAVIVYGSSTTDDSYKDYDNILLVHDMDQAYDALKGARPSFFENQVLHNSRLGKYIGINIFPYEDGVIQKYIRFNNNPLMMMESSKVIYGSFDFPIVSLKEAVERGLSQTHIKMKLIAGGLNWVYTHPERILGKPNLFEFFVKNIRFLFQNALSFKEGKMINTKSRLDRMLREDYGIVIPSYSDDPNEIRDAMIYSRHACARLYDVFLSRINMDDSIFVS